MNKRLSMLEQMTASNQADPFAWYGLAMEYRREGRQGDAIATFERLRSLDPAYLPMFLMAAQTSMEAGRIADARTWLEQGIALATQKGDHKTLGELEAALDELPGE